MSDQRNGGIAWTDETWNPIRGCSKVSQGCKVCYAEVMAARFAGPGQPYEGTITDGRWNGTVKFVPERLGDPLRWKRPRMAFVNSMSDLFHESLAFEDIAAIFGVMAASTTHTFQVLTKRPARALEFFRWLRTQSESGGAWTIVNAARTCVLRAEDAGVTIPVGTRVGRWPLPNVWLGVSVENQATADERIPLLLQCPAAVRWISVEPLLGPVDLTSALSVHDRHGEPSGPRCNPDGSAALSWVVVGGESGPGARPMHPRWARSLRDQCVEAGVPFFFKQWGDWAPNDTAETSADCDGLWVGPSGDSIEKVPRDGTTFAQVKLVEQGYTYMRRFGKHVAGRKLDGEVWDQYPTGVAA